MRGLYNLDLNIRETSPVSSERLFVEQAIRMGSLHPHGSNHISPSGQRPGEMTGGKLLSASLPTHCSGHSLSEISLALHFPDSVIRGRPISNGCPVFRRVWILLFAGLIRALELPLQLCAICHGQYAGIDGDIAPKSLYIVARGGQAWPQAGERYDAKE